jgi:hypothetical protein
MNWLRNARFYLAGPIESSDNADFWRSRLETILPHRFDSVVWNPLQKPKWIPDVDGTAQAALKSDISSERTRSINGILRKFCQHMAANCDIFIVKIDKTFTVGTFEELGIAKYKPVFVLTGESGIPSMWLVDQLDAYNNIDFVFHHGVDELVETLDRVDRGGVKFEDPYRWMFLTHNLGVNHVRSDFKNGNQSTA